MNNDKDKVISIHLIIIAMFFKFRSVQIEINWEINSVYS